MARDISEVSSPLRAITDVFDPRRGAILVRYSTKVKVRLTLSGLLAFAITGFLGYRGQTYGQDVWSVGLSILDFIFGEPWVMFVWLCALILTLETSVLRHPSLERQRQVLVMGTVVSMILGSGLYLLYKLGLRPNPCNPSCPVQLPDLTGLLGNPWTYILANSALLLALAITAALHWRRSRGQALDPMIDLQTGLPIQPKLEDLPNVEELVAGDLTTRAFAVLLLALLFRFDVIARFTSVSLPESTFTELFLFDLAVFFLALVVGLFLVGLDVNEAGLTAMDAPSAEEEGGDAAARPMSLIEVGQEMALTLIDILLSPVRRPHTAVGRRIGTSVRGSLGTLAWPLLIFVGVGGVGWLSILIKSYLQNSASKITDQLRSFLHQPDVGLLVAYVAGHLWEYELRALAAGALAIFGTTFAMAALISRWRVAGNSLRLLARLGFILLNTFCIFSVVLWGLNQLLLLLLGYYAPSNPPFIVPGRLQPFNPGVPTSISFVVLAGFGVLSIIDRPRRKRTKQGALRKEVPARVTAVGRSSQDEQG